VPELRRPAPRPCLSCPYRRDVPSGVWSEEEYAKLPPYDAADVASGQPVSAFGCHQQDGRLCAGWVAVHDMNHSIGLRVSVQVGLTPVEDVDAILEYTTDVPLWASGAEAAAHGLAEVENPSAEAVALVARLTRKQERRWA